MEFFNRPGRLWRAAVFAGAWATALAGGVHAAPVVPTGEALLGEFRCTTCHAASPAQSAWIAPKAAPRLAGLGRRVDPAWVTRYLLNPQEAKPGSTMPDVLHALPEAERASSAEALAYFLALGETTPFRRVMPDRGAVNRGEEVFHRVGCVACHDPQNPAAQIEGSVPLPVMNAKWSAEGLQQFLQDPLSLRPSGRMPSLRLTEREAADISHYLLRDTQVPAPMERIRFGGRIRSLEDLDAPEIQRSGPASDFALPPLSRERNYALRFSGWFQIEKAGRYTFHFKAVGSARLSIADGWRLGQDSWQRENVDGQSTLRLDPGWYPLVIDFVQRGSKEPSITLEWEGPGIAREVFAPSRLRHSREPIAEPVAFVVDPAKVVAGRRIYDQLHCAACHEPNGTTAPAPALAALNATRGCLADAASVPVAVPRFTLTPVQRASLSAAIQRLSAANVPAPSPRERVSQAMSAFRCVACHARGGMGGVASERDAFFTSSGEDLGDEGRIPPRLDGVGDKLRPEWLREVLSQGTGVRPYLHTRMPVFGAGNVAWLAETFVSLDRHAMALPANSDTPEVQREAGRKLVGTDGLSCIVCHRFNRQPAHTMQVLDLITTPTRLNEDWFHRFLRDPNQFNSGTRMPAFWPDGVSPMPAVLGGNTSRQHAAIWTYLSDGLKARFPEGLSRQSMELTVGGETVVYRGKLWEAGFRAVAVGHPGGSNLAFDAEELRLSLLWRGRFLNAAPHWGVQGMGQIRPLGSNVVVFPHGPAFAELPDAQSPWPKASSRSLGIRFHGYQLDPLKRPTLLYSVRGSAVQDVFLPIESAEGGGALRRTLSFDKTPEPAGTTLYLRLASGNLKAIAANAWRLDDTLTLRVGKGVSALVRTSEGRQELLIPIETSNGPTRLEVDYVW